MKFIWPIIAALSLAACKKESTQTPQREVEITPVKRSAIYDQELKVATEIQVKFLRDRIQVLAQAMDIYKKPGSPEIDLQMAEMMRSASSSDPGSIDQLRKLKKGTDSKIPAMLLNLFEETERLEAGYANLFDMKKDRSVSGLEATLQIIAGVGTAFDSLNSQFEKVSKQIREESPPGVFPPQ